MIKRIRPGNQMKEQVLPGRNTPQQKLVHAANRFGNRGLKDGQGSTYIIYDYIQLAEGLNQEGTVIKFFKNAGNRAFPFTNLMEGRLPVGEGFVLERMWFNILTVTTATGEVQNMQTFSEFAVNGFYKADFDFTNANQVVIKGQPLTKQKPQFNMFARHTVNEVIHLDTDITVQPLIEFECDLTLPALTVPTSGTLDFYIGCYAEGAGALMNPRANY